MKKFLFTKSQITSLCIEKRTNFEYSIFYFIPKPFYLYPISIENHWYTGVCMNIINYNVKRSWLVPRDLKRFPCKRYKELPQPHLINTQVHVCLIKRTHWRCGIKVILIKYLDVLFNRLLSSKHVLLIDLANQNTPTSVPIIVIYLFTPIVIERLLQLLQLI